MIKYIDDTASVTLLSYMQHRWHTKACEKQWLEDILILA